MRAYKTNLRCEACVAQLQPLLDARIGPGRWRVDLNSPDKILYAEAEAAVVEAILRQAGYTLLGELPLAALGPPPSSPGDQPPSYYPLLLVLAFIAGGTLLLQWRLPQADAMRAMSDFMGLFFVGFAFFKLLEVPAFARAYAGYDWIAQRWYVWGFIYPFIELTLGLFYLLHLFPLIIHTLTLGLMSVGSLGVAQALWQRRAIRCACLGSIFNLPMSFVSLAEDLSMAVMAAGMLVLEGMAYFRT